MGMLAIDETRMMAATPEGFDQLERLVRRDRNHPSVLQWALGNEELEQTTERGARIVTSMRSFAKRLDPTRLITVAQNREFGKGVFPAVDVQGCNYREEQIDGFHKNFPKQPMIGTETGSIVSTCGAYLTDRDKGYVGGGSDSTHLSVAGSRAGLVESLCRAKNPQRSLRLDRFRLSRRTHAPPYGWPCIRLAFRPDGYVRLSQG